MKKSPLDQWHDEVNETGQRLFQEMNRLKLTQRRFTLEALANRQPHGGKTLPDLDCFDHAEFYKSTDGRPYRAACIIAHNYGADASVKKACDDVARRYGLQAHVLADKAKSWWFPGSTTTVAYTPRGGKVVWPEWKKAVGPEPPSASV